MAPSPGTVRSVHGIDLCRSMPGVHLADADVRPGQRLELHNSFRDRIGHVIAIGPDPATAADRASAAAGVVRVELDPSEQTHRHDGGRNANARTA